MKVEKNSSFDDWSRLGGAFHSSDAGILYYCIGASIGSSIIGASIAMDCIGGRLIPLSCHCCQQVEIWCQSWVSLSFPIGLFSQVSIVSGNVLFKWPRKNLKFTKTNLHGMENNCSVWMEIVWNIMNWWHILFLSGGNFKWGRQKLFSLLAKRQTRLLCSRW